MKPWQARILDRARDFIRFCLWTAVAINSAMVCIFSIFFTYEFLHHTWQWCLKTLFAEDW